MDRFTSQLKHLTDQASDRLPDLVITLVVGLVLVELAIIVLGYVLRLSRIPDGLKRILYSLARTFLWIILFLVLVQTLGLNNVLVAVTGSSVIVALFLSAGVAPVVTDVLAGLSLAADSHFQPGVKVRAGEAKTEGIIETMDLRKTRIKDASGRIHVISNSVIDRNEWVVIKAKPGLRRRRRFARLRPKR
jgi:small-conductance mechanosensitive channel